MAKFPYAVKVDGEYYQAGEKVPDTAETKDAARKAGPRAKGSDQQRGEQDGDAITAAGT